MKIRIESIVQIKLSYYLSGEVDLLSGPALAAASFEMNDRISKLSNSEFIWKLDIDGRSVLPDVASGHVTDIRPVAGFGVEATVQVKVIYELYASEVDHDDIVTTLTNHANSESSWTITGDPFCVPDRVSGKILEFQTQADTDTDTGLRAEDIAARIDAISKGLSELEMTIVRLEHRLESESFEDVAELLSGLLNKKLRRKTLLQDSLDSLHERLGELGLDRSGPLLLRSDYGLYFGYYQGHRQESQEFWCRTLIHQGSRTDAEIATGGPGPDTKMSGWHSRKFLCSKALVVMSVCPDAVALLDAAPAEVVEQDPRKADLDKRLGDGAYEDMMAAFED